MAYRYRNANTGQVVEYAERDAWLDRFPQWSLDEQPAAEPVEPPPAPEPERPELVEPEQLDEQPRVARPAQRASVAAWRDYALALGVDRALVEDSNKAELIALTDDLGDRA